MSISRQQLYAAGEPFGDSSSRIEGGRRIYGGGGDSGGGQTYYANQDKLLGVQADIAQGIYNNIYAPNAPGAVGNLARMVKEAESGKLTSQARATAAADAGAATGQAIDATNRNLARYGLDPHKFGADSSTIALGAAANKTDAMNKAQQWGEGQRWGRSYDFYNALAGVPSQTTAALGSAAAGYGTMGRAQTDVDIANAQGYGQMGGMIGSALLKKKDGGLVRKPKPVRMKNGGRCMASGGLMTLPNWRNQSTAGSKYPDARQDPVAGVLRSAATTYGVGQASDLAKEGVSQAFRAATSQAPAPVATANPVPAAQITDAAAQSGNAAAANAANAAPAAEAAATEGAGAAVTDAAATGVADAAVAGAAEGAATTAAAEGAGTAVAGEVAATNAWNPVGWAAAVYGVGSLAGWWADGGEVRDDMTGGGNVSGPGGPTDDKIKAWLSDGEYVLNAEAVKKIGVKALDKINNAGLAARGDQGKQSQGAHLAMGGIMLGAAANEMNRQREQSRQDNADRRAEESLSVLKKNAEQEQAMRGIQITQAKQLQADDQQFRTRLKGLAENMNKIKAGDLSPAQSLIESQYNQQKGPFGDGVTIEGAMSTPGGGMAGTMVGKDGTKQPFELTNDQVAQRYMMAELDSLKFENPQMFMSWQKGNQEALQKAAEISSREKIAAGNNEVQREGQKLTHEIGIRNAKAHEMTAGASAALHGIQAQSARMELDQTKLARSGLVKKQRGEAPTPEEAAAMSSASATGKNTVQSAFDGEDGNKHLVLSNGTTVNTGVKVKGDITPGKAWDIAAKIMPQGIGAAAVTKAQQEVYAAMKGPGQTAKPSSEADAQAQAKAAIAKGADRSAVNARLKQMGFGEIQ